MTRRISSRLVAGVLGAVLVADGLAVTHLREQERDRAVAAEQARDRAWVEQVRQIAVDLQAARAPISDAANVGLGDVGDAVRYDVYIRGSALADFDAQQQRLAAVAVPAPRRQAHADLSGALQGMTDVVRQLAEDDDSSDVEDELQSFAARARKWDATIMQHVARDVPLATTAGDKVALTATGHVYRWSRACGEGLFQDQELGAPGEDREKAAVVFRGYAYNLEDTLDALLAVPVSAAQPEAVARDVQPALRGLRDAAKAMHSFADALGGSDRAKAAQSLVLLDRVAPLFETASEAFQAAGSSVCSEYFDPGLLGGDGRDGDDLART